LSKMKEGNDIRQHLDEFFGAVDKLNQMDSKMNNHLLTIMLLNSLFARFETRDQLPNPEALKAKILKEADARKNEPTWFISRKRGANLLKSSEVTAIMTTV